MSRIQCKKKKKFDLEIHGQKVNFAAGSFHQIEDVDFIYASHG